MAVYLNASAVALRFCRFYMRWIYFPMADHHITASKHTAEELVLASRGHKVRRGIWVCPMGVDCDRFHPGRRSEAGRLKLLEGALSSRGENTTTSFFMPGGFHPEKNLSLLVEHDGSSGPGSLSACDRGHGN